MNGMQTEAYIRRPLGVWMMPPVDFLLASALVVFAAPRYLFPPRHATLPPDINHWILLGLAVLAMGTSYGVWAGNKTARKLLLAAIAFCLPLLVYAFVDGIILMYQTGQQEWFSYALLEFAAFAAFVLILLALNWWAFSRRSARAFFVARSRGRPWFATRGMLLAGIGIPALVFGGYEALYQFTGAPSHPPPILAEQLRIEPATGLGKWQAFNRFLELRYNIPDDPVEIEQSKKFTALLKQHFPPGTSETALIAALKDQGFFAPGSPGTECSQDAKAPNGERCRDTPPPAKTLDYGWWRFHGWRRGQCTEVVRVRWQALHGKVTEVKGKYHKICGFVIEPRHWNYW